MAYYQWAAQYVPPGVVEDYTPIPASAYGFSGEASDVFALIWALDSPQTYVEQPVPVPYGPAGGAAGPAGA